MGHNIPPLWAFSIATVVLAISVVTAGWIEVRSTNPVSAGTERLVPSYPTFGRVNLIPNPMPFLVTGSGESPTPVETVGHSFVTPDLYNINSTSSIGAVEMTNHGDPSSLTTEVGFSHVTMERSLVVGYPEVQYGYRPWCSSPPCASPPLDDNLTLPARADSLPTIWSITHYAVWNQPSGSTPFDFAYDIWLTRGTQQSNATNGDLEVMIWLDYTTGVPAILPDPSWGTNVGTRNIPTLEGGSVAMQSWVVYAYNGGRSLGASDFSSVIFVLPQPVSEGLLGVNITGAVTSAAGVLAQDFPSSWGTPGTSGRVDPTRLYMNDIELGSEFKPSSTDSASFGWDLVQYCYVVGPRNPGLLSVDGDLGCGPAAAPGAGPTPRALFILGTVVIGQAAAALGIAAWSGWLPFSRSVQRMSHRRGAARRDGPR